MIRRTLTNMENNIINLADWCTCTNNLMKLSDKAFIHTGAIRVATIKPQEMEICKIIPMDTELTAILAKDPTTQYQK